MYIVASRYLAAHINATGCVCFINPGFASTSIICCYSAASPGTSSNPVKMLNKQYIVVYYIQICFNLYVYGKF